MSTDKEFTVAIYVSEYKQICAWVFKNQDLETGGDLFGLWYDDYTAVVQFVLGPGTNCQRTTTSFFQDVEYLEKVGSRLTGKEGLCHIGEWHSHHKIGLKQPSNGDKRTVWTNMPKYGLSRFLLFIANFETHESTYDSVSVGCFLFKESKTSHRKLFSGRFKLLPTESPFRSKCVRNPSLIEGAEGLNENKEINSLDEVVTGSSEMKEDGERPLMVRDESKNPAAKHCTAEGLNESNEINSSEEVVSGSSEEQEDVMQPLMVRDESKSPAAEQYPAESLNESNEINSLNKVITGSSEMQENVKRPLMVREESKNPAAKHCTAEGLNESNEINSSEEVVSGSSEEQEDVKQPLMVREESKNPAAEHCTAGGLNESSEINSPEEVVSGYREERDVKQPLMVRDESKTPATEGCKCCSVM